MRVNLGCGQAYMPGWVNVDASPDAKADVYLDAVDFVRQYGDQVEEVYLGHVLEHLLPGDALVLLTLLRERLPQSAVVSAVVPDILAGWAAYQRGEGTNYQLNASFIYSYVQPSHHKWCYDYHKEGPESRWQCGVKATAKGTPTGGFDVLPDLASDEATGQPVAEQRDEPAGPDEVELQLCAQTLVDAR